MPTFPRPSLHPTNQATGLPIISLSLSHSLPPPCIYLYHLSTPPTLTPCPDLMLRSPLSAGLVAPRKPLRWPAASPQWTNASRPAARHSDHPPGPKAPATPEASSPARGSDRDAGRGKCGAKKESAEGTLGGDRKSWMEEAHWVETWKWRRKLDDRVARKHSIGVSILTKWFQKKTKLFLCSSLRDPCFYAIGHVPMCQLQRDYSCH